MASAELVSGRVLAALTGRPACGPANAPDVPASRMCGNGRAMQQLPARVGGRRDPAHSMLPNAW